MKLKFNQNQSNFILQALRGLRELEILSEAEYQQKLALFHSYQGVKPVPGLVQPQVPMQPPIPPQAMLQEQAQLTLPTETFQSSPQQPLNPETAQAAAQPTDLSSATVEQPGIQSRPVLPTNAASVANQNPMHGEVLVTVKNFTKRYSGNKIPAVENISFEIRRGQFHAFVGANGAGKTTTMKALVGAYAKWEGEIKINGLDNRKAEAKQKVGYVPEQTLFPKGFKAREYLQIMAELSGLETGKAKQFAQEKLNEFNMQNLANQSPKRFSSGQKKKILCAQALCHNPEILILDEPAANLDPIARQELFDLLKRVQAQGKAIFISSHILAEIGRYADYVTILDGGRIVYSGPVLPEQDLEKLYNQYVRIGSVHTAKQPLNWGPQQNFKQ